MPTGLALDTSTDSGTQGDGVTNYQAVMIDGTAEANSTVVLKDGSTVVGTGTANGSGVFHITTSQLADGVHQITAVSTDAAGNASPASNAYPLTIDTSAPITSVADAATAASVLTVTGGSEPSASVTLMEIVGGTSTPLKTGIQTDATGKWSVSIGSISDTVHQLTAKAVDAAGNAGPTSLSLILGSSGADTLVGTANADVIIGQGGNDKLTGGA